ncbi:MAG: thiamine pyrophosphate-dependent enzyme, partial [Desulfobacterales bacterium]
VEVYEAAKKAVDKIRKGEGPYIIEGLTFRKSGHHVNDPGLYMPKDTTLEESSPVSAMNWSQSGTLRIRDPISKLLNHSPGPS